jgi:sigma-B regulation protein RsbU (phosphoserine phosphatase)
MERELELARELQQSILPQRFPTLPGFALAAYSRPARQVAGDFYDVIPLGNGHAGLLIADVSDKGMPAALYMARAHSLIHAEAKRSHSPKRVLLNVHRQLLEMTRVDMFVTVFYAVLDSNRGTLRYARAGHDPPLLVRSGDGACSPLAAKGMLLGNWSKVTLEEAEAQLRPGDSLVLYTDGITDSNAPDGEFFGLDRLCEVVSAAGDVDAEELCHQILDQVARFQAGAAQHDDMALLVVKANEAREFA